MNTIGFYAQLDARIRKYHLLTHPFYQAWSDGKLTAHDLREYACDYFHQVEAFPSYLQEFGARLEEGQLRRAVLRNRADELGMGGAPSHAELWLDFAAGMGGWDRSRGEHEPLAEVRDLVDFFLKVARQGAPEEALAAFYAYESQVPTVAEAKARGLKELYGADEKTRAYFILHTTADVYHSRVWRHELGKLVENDPAAANRALRAGERAAKSLWNALDGIENRRTGAQSVS